MRERAKRKRATSRMAQGVATLSQVETGAASFVQRFGGSLNLHVHVSRARATFPAEATWISIARTSASPRRATASMSTARCASRPTTKADRGSCATLGLHARGVGGAHETDLGVRGSAMPEVLAKDNPPCDPHRAWARAPHRGAPRRSGRPAHCGAGARPHVGTDRPRVGGRRVERASGAAKADMCAQSRDRALHGPRARSRERGRPARPPVRRGVGGRKPLAPPIHPLPSTISIGDSAAAALRPEVRHDGAGRVVTAARRPRPPQLEEDRALAPRRRGGTSLPRRSWHERLPRPWSRRPTPSLDRPPRSLPRRLPFLDRRPKSLPARPPFLIRRPESSPALPR